jgi:signal peptidase II
MAAFVVAADFLTKEWVRAWVESHPGERVIYTLGFIRIVPVENTGAAFGLFPGITPALAVVSMVGVVAMLVIAVVAQRRYPHLITRLHVAVMGLLLGGAVGNLIGRVGRGQVTDFVDVGFWPAFNVADSAVTIGIVLLAFWLLRQGLQERRQAA